MLPNEQQSRRELDNCTFVKTVLMLIVVLYHSILFWGGSWFTKDPALSAQPLALLAGWMDSFHIYGFTLVSGYLFYYIKCEKGGYGSFVPFAVNKAKRLLVPYAFAAAVWVIPVQYAFFRPDAMTLAKNYLLGINPAQLWFLLMLFCVFLLFWPMAGFLRKHAVLGAGLMLGLYGCGIVGGMVLPNVFRVFTALQYLPVFYLGFTLRQHGTGLLRRLPAPVWLGLSVALFALTRYLAGFDSALFKLLTMGFEFLTHVVGALMAFAVLQAVADRVSWKRSRIFAFLSRRSMAVYLFHQQVIYFLIAGFNGAVNPYVHGVVNFVGCLGASLVIASVLMKFRFTRMLIGEK